jgi:hypothetical protein
MIAFDAADRNVCTVRRQSTSTPLQALALLNDTQIVEAARHLSERMLNQGTTNLEERIAWAFQAVTARTPTRKEAVVLKQLYDEQRQLFVSDSQAAEKLLAVGDTKTGSPLDRADVCAGTVLALALLNHDEALLRR